MLFLLGSALSTVAAFVIVYHRTGSVWWATNVAGVICLVYSLGTARSIVRSVPQGRTRTIISSVTALILVGSILQWSIVYRMTDFQYDTLQKIRGRIFHGSMMSALYERGLNTFAELWRRPDTPGLADAFRRVYPSTMPLVDSLLMREQGTVTVSTESDSVVTLVGQAIFVKGDDSTFVNFDGRHGLAQHRVRITREGVFYVVEN